MKTISIPTCNRVDNLKRCLDSIRAAQGHGEWVLVFASEPNQDVAELIKRTTWVPTYQFCNLIKLGCRLNTFMANAYAMALGSEFNLYLEDDLIISEDALVLARQFMQSSSEGILCLRRWHDSQMPRPEIVEPSPHGLLGNGFAYRKRMWPTLAKYWFYDSSRAGGKMWDWTVSLGLDDEGILQWRPMLNRSRSTGVFGTHTQNGLDLNHFGPLYTGNPVDHFTFTK